MICRRRFFFLDLLDETKESSKLDICGDGWCDSPGHCAKYGTYTVMEENSSKIPDFEVVQVTEISSSNAMEAEGCNQVLKNLKTKGVKVRCLTTDRHTTVTAEMRKKILKLHTSMMSGIFQNGWSRN